MTAGLAVMMLGLFGVPVALLWLGHRLRRRTARQRAVFWWALGGYVVAIIFATVAAFWPPAHWSGSDLLRGLAGFVSLLLLPLLGGAVGAVRGGREQRHG